MRVQTSVSLSEVTFGLDPCKDDGKIVGSPSLLTHVEVKIVFLIGFVDELSASMTSLKDAVVAVIRTGRTRQSCVHRPR